jgi:HEAT repeat protein
LALRAVFERVGLVALTERGTRRFSPWRRALACELLGNIGLSRSVPVLVARLDDRRPEVRAAAVRALGVLGSSAAAPALTAAFLERRCAPSNVVSDALRRLGPVGRDAFIEGSRSSDPIVRVSSCFGLAATAGLGRRLAHDRLTELLYGDPDDGVRTAAANALEIVGGSTVSDKLTAAASDSDVRVRRAAVRALGAFDDPQAAEALAGCTDDDDREVAIRAAEALMALAGRPGAAVAAQALLEASGDWSVGYVRTIAEVTEQADDLAVAAA